jgi:hypothetical protein
MNKNFNITPDWITGFTPSDGSFVVSFMGTKSVYQLDLYLYLTLLNL